MKTFALWTAVRVDGLYKLVTKDRLQVAPGRLMAW